MAACAGEPAATTNTEADGITNQNTNGSVADTVEAASDAGDSATGPGDDAGAASGDATTGGDAATSSDTVDDVPDGGGTTPPDTDSDGTATDGSGGTATDGSGATDTVDGTDATPADDGGTAVSGDASMDSVADSNDEQDSDGDGVPDSVEVFLGTDPNDADTDGDGLSDGLELGKVGDADPTTETSPLVADTDGDGLTDGEEDLDGDGAVDSFESDPNTADTDGDGLSDGEEAAASTNPNKPDSDSDGVGDAVELGGAGDADPSTKTDPTNPDSDGDGMLDGAEDKNGNGAVDIGEADPLDKQDGGAPPPDPCESVDCDDGNLCTADGCDGGSCTHQPVADGAACAAGSACINGACQLKAACVPPSDAVFVGLPGVEAFVDAEAVSVADFDACIKAGACAPMVPQNVDCYPLSGLGGGKCGCGSKGHGFDSANGCLLFEPVSNLCVSGGGSKGICEACRKVQSSNWLMGRENHPVILRLVEQVGIGPPECVPVFEQLSAQDKYAYCQWKGGEVISDAAALAIKDAAGVAWKAYPNWAAEMVKNELKAGDLQTWKLDGVVTVATDTLPMSGQLPLGIFPMYWQTAQQFYWLTGFRCVYKLPQECK